ncbi:MAG: toxin-antitoxin system YwqK family antitoxin [Sphingobacteriaceae bacterium]|nr:toxin-antitoxin system YwqK family antitoxin [Sphingobacteriaceae bacterium]
MKAVLLIMGFLSFISLNAQQLNQEGLFVNTDGTLYTGVFASNEKGVRFEMNIKEGKKDGTATYYFASGKVLESGEYKNGLKENKWTRYNESGIVSAIGFYSAGKKHGNWLVFDEHGNKRFEMNYLNGEKTGEWINWDESGAIVSTKNFGSVN